VIRLPDRSAHKPLRPTPLCSNRPFRFGRDVDVQPAEGVRVVQLTPPGSACSIMIGSGLQALADMAPGAIKGLHLLVRDIAEARNGISPA
jgi:hypothetical protein